MLGGVALLASFQFHKGTIKTFCFRNVINSKFNFNSIKVRLKQLDGEVEDLLHQDFNSIKVRLKLKDGGKEHVSCTFQFHKGTIKTSDSFLLYILGH